MTTGDGNRGGEADRQDRQGSQSPALAWMTTAVDRLWDSVEKERERGAVDRREERRGAAKSRGKEKVRADSASTQVGWIRGFEREKDFPAPTGLPPLAPSASLSSCLRTRDTRGGSKGGKEAGERRWSKKRKCSLSLVLSRWRPDFNSRLKGGRE